MDETTFWDLLERSRAATEDQDDRLEWLTAELTERPPHDIADFQVLLDHIRGRADTWDHWGAAHLICGGSSDDGFFYFLAWLVGLGRDSFTRIAEDPDELATIPLVQELAGVDVDDWGPDDWPGWEALDYVAREAYRRLTGESDGLDAALTVRGHEPMVTPDPEGIAWEFDVKAELIGRLPRLSALFSERVAHG
jgi:hypothetical protein